MASRKETKDLFRTDVDAYGRPKRLMGKIDDIYNDFDKKLEEIISYIEKEVEVPIPIEAFFNEDGTHITKREYGKILLQEVAKDLRKKYI